MKRTLFWILAVMFMAPPFVPKSVAQDSLQGPLPEGAVARFGKGNISAVQYSPDGTRLAVAGSIGTWLYDAQTGESLDLLIGHKAEVLSVAFSSDGQTLASGSIDATVRVWDAGTGEHIHTLIGHTDAVHSVAFSPDGQTLVSGSGDATARVWNAVSGEHIHTLIGHKGGVLSVTFSPDGQTLASGSWDGRESREGTVQVWDAKTGEHIHTLEHTGRFISVAFSPDGQTLATADNEDDTVRVWDAKTGEHIRTLATGRFYSVAFSPDGQTLVAGGWYRLYVLDAVSGEHIHTLIGHTSGALSVAFSPDGQTLVSVGHDATVRVWDAVSGEPRLTLEHTAPVSTVAFSPDGSTLATGGFPEIRVWNVGTGQTLRTLTEHSGRVLSVVFSPDGQTLASGSYDHTIRVRDAGTGTLRYTLTGHTSVVYSVEFSPDGQMLASGSWDNTVRVWDAGTGALRYTLAGNGFPIFGDRIAFSPDGSTLVYADTHWNAILWDIGSEEPRLTLEHEGLGIHSVAFSPDGQTLATGGYYGTAILWDTVSGELRLTLEHTAPVDTLAFSPDSRTLATGSWDGTVRVWDAVSGERLRTFRGHVRRSTRSGAVPSVVFSPDGTAIASGGTDGTVILWDAIPFISERGQQDEEVRQTQPDTGTQQTQGDTTIQSYEREMVRLIYFRPSDQPSRQGIDTELDTLIRWSQYFFAEQMQDYGDQKTFAFETEPNGYAKVYHVTGKFTDTYYHQDTYDKVVKEVTEQFDTSRDVFLIAVDVSSEFINDAGTCGVGGGTWQSFDNERWRRDFGGVAVIPASGACTNPSIAAHELGHVFGLEHDFRDDTYLMAYGTQQRLSDCAAEWLDAHRFFNDDPETSTAVNDALRLEMQVTRATLPGAFRLQFELTDADGLHQAQLIVPATASDPAHGTKLHSCKSLNGKSQTVEFITTDLTVRADSEVTLQVIDERGGITKQTFPLTIQDDTSPRLVATTGVSSNFDDPFEGTDLQNPNWQWQNEPANWDVGETRDGFLHIESETNRNLWASDASHFLYQETDADTFDVETHFFSRWDTSSGVNGLVVKSPADNNWVTIKFWSRDAGAKGQIQYQTRGQGLVADPAWRPEFGATELFLRLRKQGDTYTGWYKTREADPWIEIGVANFPLTPPLQLGIYAGVAAPTGTLTVDYDYFRSTIDTGVLASPALQFAAMAAPRETTLLPNYPNPFNPETWIPYQLASPSDVTVHIHAVNGSLIRRLPLGHQAAGMYHGRSRAAYWDGRNELGEPVASGVYFYTLTAGDFTATRKMLIRK